MQALITATLDNFLHADLYASTCRFLKGSKGSFGLAVTCSLDPDRCERAVLMDAVIALCAMCRTVRNAHLLHLCGG